MWSEDSSTLPSRMKIEGTEIRPSQQGNRSL
jgi:hypothetical protein